MSRAALTMLSRDPDGFVVSIEGGAPDWASHDNDLGRFLEEMAEFNQAIAATIEWVEKNSSWKETLLIVTADHETGGLWGRQTWIDADSDKRFDAAKGDRFISHFAPRATGAGQQPDLQYSTGGHSGDLVPLWALGAGAQSLNHQVRTDTKAAALWGAAYGWDGRFIDNTTIHRALAQTGCGED